MTSRVQQQLPELIALAHDRSESARLKLAGKLSELFLTDNISLTVREEQLVNELIDLLLKSNSPTLRSELARKFAETPKIPRTMALHLALEGADVAKSVLVTNETLTDEDLITVVELKGGDHACAVAARRAVSEAVADALVTTGDVRVMQTVAENFGAKLSPKALEILAETSRMVESLQKPILHRPELNTDTALSLYWWVSEELRRYVMQRFGVSSGQLDQALTKTVETEVDEHALDRTDDLAMMKLADWLETHKAVNPKTLVQLLRMGHFRLFNILIGRLSDLRIPLIDIIVGESGGRMLAALCRAVNIDKANFVSIFLLSRGARPDEQIVHPRELSHAIAAFERLTAEMALSLLRSWRSSPEYLLRRSEDEVVLGA